LVGTKINGRDVLRTSAGVVQLKMNRTFSDKPDNIVEITWRFIMLPYMAITGDCAHLFSGLLRASAVLRDASGVLRAAQNISLPTCSMVRIVQDGTALSVSQDNGTVGIKFHLPSRDSTLVQLLRPGLLGDLGHFVAIALLQVGNMVPSGLLSLLSDLLVLQPLSMFVNNHSGAEIVLPVATQLASSGIQVVQRSALKQALHYGHTFGNEEIESPPVSPAHSLRWRAPASSEVVLTSPPQGRAKILSSASMGKIFPNAVQSPLGLSRVQLGCGSTSTAPLPKVSSTRKGVASAMSPDVVRNIYKALSEQKIDSEHLSTQAADDWESIAPDTHQQMTFSANVRLQAAARLALQLHADQPRDSAK
jgi:hypothetical protein